MLRKALNNIIKTTNPMTWLGFSMNLEGYSSLYLINPPKLPGMFIPSPIL